MNRSKPVSSPAAVAAAVAPSSSRKSSAPVAPAASEPSSAQATDAFSSLPPPLDPHNLDRSIDPSQDFFHFANGGWLKTHPIRADRTSNSNFSEVQDRNQKILLQELAALAANPPDISTTKGKLAAYYRSGMDLEAIEKAGLKPVAPVLQQVANLSSTDELARTMAKLKSLGTKIPFGIGSDRDPKDSKQVIAALGQGGLGLPNKTYYTKTDPDTLKYVAAYQDYAARLFELTGDDAATARKNVATVMTIERQLAAASLTPEERRDPTSQYNPMSLAELEQRAPGFPWKIFFDSIGLTATDKINVGQPKFVEALGQMFQSVPLEDWKTYLRLRFTAANASYLGKDFAAAVFDFSSKVSGVTERSPREEMVLDVLSGDMGEATGRIFVDKAFQPEAKARMDELVANIRASMADHIRALPWMSDETKARGLEKLAAIKPKIGYPQEWESYDDLEIGSSYAENHLRSNERDFKKDIAAIGKPPDPDEFGMTADTVNAYYSADANEIVFPAGILQPPFFDPRADDAVNYGGIGAVIAHEITHGFDDQGRQYDAAGNLNNWWTPKDEAEYAKRVQPLIDQFNALNIDGVPVNGKLTLGENLADLSGLAIAHDAFLKSLEGKPPPKKIDGFTAEQRFFLSFATNWRSNDRLERLKKQVKTDPHAPHEFRTNVPLSNSIEFRRAFHIRTGTPLARPAKDRAVIW